VRMLKKTGCTKKMKYSPGIKDLAIDIISNIQTGIYVYQLADREDDRTLTMVYANKASESFTGVPPERVIDRTLDENFPGLRAMGIPQRYAEVVRSGKAIELEDVYYGDARVISSWFAVKAFPLPHNCVGVSFDKITERKRYERILQEERNKARQYLAIADVMIGALDAEGCVVLMNPKGCSILGCKEKDIVGKDWFDNFIPLRLREGLKDAFHQIMNGDIAKVEYYENAVLHSSGEERIMAFHNTVIRDEEGNITGVLSSGEDITDRKRAEEEKRKLEEQLLHSQKLEAVGLLAGGIAHEFSNVLATVKGSVYLMQKYLRNNSRLMRYCEQIAASVNRANDLSRSLLMFSRKQPVELRPVHFNGIVLRTAQLLYPLIGEHIELSTSLTEMDTTVMADLVQMDQLIVNLATNARDAMPDGGKLAISTAVVDMDEKFIREHGYGVQGRYILLTVSDSGTGMNEETRGKIFQPFFTTKAVGKGSGLGLAITYGIVKQHSGFIDVESVPATGTTFRIYLPAVKAEVAASKSPETRPVPGGAETILFAEDETDTRTTMAEILRMAGYVVLESKDGKDALRVFRENEQKVQLALLDVRMPQKNGMEVCEAIRRRNPSAKCLFISGYTGNIIDSHGINEVGGNFISKSATPDDILKKIREVLDR
jgi:PAS domain S-box-containing protein